MIFNIFATDSLPHIFFFQDILKKKVKCVFLYRNPKDVVVSLYHHTKGINMFEYNGKFENFVQMFMRGDGKLMYFLLVVLALLRVQSELFWSSGVNRFSVVRQLNKRLILLNHAVELTKHYRFFCMRFYHSSVKNKQSEKKN